jgi:hypothetical protein
MRGTSDAFHNGDKPNAESSCNWTRRQLLARIGKLTAGTLVSTMGWGAQERAAARQPATASPSAPAAPARDGANGNGAQKPEGGANGGGCMIVGAVVICGSATVFLLA